MSKAAVAYFSATSTTRRVAERLAKAAGADLFEIVPETRYTNADLNWHDTKSRSSVESKDADARPAIASRVPDMECYDTLYIGFPIWWYEAPRIIQSFLESYDLSGKTVIPFATSGGSGMGRTAEILKASAPGARVLSGKRFSAAVSEAELGDWIKNDK